MYSSYGTLNNQCRPQTVANVNNTKYLLDTVPPILKFDAWYNISNRGMQCSNPNPKIGLPNKCNVTGPGCTANGVGERKVETCSAKKGNGKNAKEIWGNNLWTYLHYSAMNYPDQPSAQEVEDMKNWLCALSTTIPCAECKKHYRGYIEKSKPQLDNICSNKDNLFRFLFELHNKVNARLGKPVLTYEQAVKMYENDGTCTDCKK